MSKHAIIKFVKKREGGTMNLDRCMGSLLLVAIGDAYGVPFETMTAEEIEDLEILGYVINDYFAPSINPHPFPDVVGKPKGSWSDDTQLTLVTMSGLIEGGGRFDMDVLAKKHIEAYQHSTKRGWGKSHRNACRRLSEGIHWSKSGEQNGAGNGVMMKIAPLGLCESLQNRQFFYFLRECIDYARMTHGGQSAIVAGCVHATAVAMLAQSTGEIPENFFSHLLAHAVLVEQYLPPAEDEISNQILLLKKLYEEGILQKESPRKISKRFGGETRAAFFAYNSFATAYAAFLRNPHTFDCIADCIRMGGDTDSNAAITGSLVGALNGVAIIPQKFIDVLEDSEEIKKQIELFYNVCAQK